MLSADDRSSCRCALLRGGEPAGGSRCPGARFEMEEGSSERSRQVSALDSLEPLGPTQAFLT